MNISTDTGKDFDEIQKKTFMVKALVKLGIEETYLNIIKVICDKPIDNIILNWEKLKPFSLKSETR
jgi:hypothetical protein